MQPKRKQIFEETKIVKPLININTLINIPQEIWKMDDRQLYENITFLIYNNKL